ncbi:DUF2680 domain-containing protein [Sporomusa sphaeroides]|uniref:DUF2680 domain-containing protein n=1 Tax=Sporomusa sphaeroides TaxID=47679 RepID=UPI002C413F2A|nr:DUF2680 domain-containing protein [Sporomusa sphaeroides]HML31976.1 DUF2680 domain-containing protein [Sporomusa sphaeroides]
MKKPLLLTVAGLLVLAFAVSFASAATPPPQNFSQRIVLTDTQKQELAPLFTQMMDIKKQILQKLVADGTMTQADADQRAAWMQERMNYRMQNGIGGGHGSGMMGPGHGRGPGNGYGPRGQQQAPVSNQ